MNCKKYYDYDDIKYKEIGAVRTVFDLSIGEDYYDPKKVLVALIIIISNMKVKEIKTKLYQLKSILIWLDHI